MTAFLLALLDKGQHVLLLHSLDKRLIHQSLRYLMRLLGLLSGIASIVPHLLIIACHIIVMLRVDKLTKATLSCLVLIG